MPRYLTAQEAAAELDITVETLYAYVSRGLIRSESAGENSRARRYAAEDVRRLKDRKEHRHDPEKAAQDTLNWGTPVLESALTLIDDGRLYYRGRDALELARQAAFEEVAALLWTGDLNAAQNLFEPGEFSLPGRCQAGLAAAGHGLTLFERFQAALPLAAADDLSAYDLRPPAVAQTGARILRLLTAVAASETRSTSIAGALAQVWKPGDDRAAELVNAALILCADHELNVSSFTARCAASAGSTPYAAVLAGLAALQGTKHGGYTESTLAFLRSIGKPENTRAALAERLKRGEKIPGFGHRLYPDGDPRAALLLERITTLYPDTRAVTLAQTVRREVRAVIDEEPSLDFALAALAEVMELPAGSGLALFALGRTAGWIGHAIEQYTLDRLIRPRARYTGAQPDE